MQTLQAIRRRIGNAEDLQSLVRTMKAIAAVNVRQYEKSIQALADYNRTTEMGLQVVLRQRAAGAAPTGTKAGKSVGVIVFGSDQGLCGQFNEQIAAHTVAMLEEMGIRHQDRLVLAVGARAAARLEEAGQPVASLLAVPGSLAGVTATVQEALWMIERRQAEGHIDQVLLFYNRMLSGAVYQPRMVHLWPIDPERFSSLEKAAWPSRALPTFSMDWDALFSALLHQHLFVSLWRAFAESLASENASRLVSMQVAERNIEEKLVELNALFHHRRQDGITGELLDIISGFEVLSED